MKEFAAKHADLEVTRIDSLNAGNCPEGTDDFIEGCLDGKTTVTVSDLVPFIEDISGVRLLLAYILRQAEGQSEAPEEPSEDTSDETMPF